jgi:hypothetical protein
MARTVTGGFGTAPQGGSYSTTPASKFSVANGTGHITAVVAGQNVGATLSTVQPANEQVQSTFNLPVIPVSGNGVYYSLEFRRPAANNAYRAQVRVSPGGRLTLGFNRINNGVQTGVGAQVLLAQRVTPGHTIILQGQVTGLSTVSLRARAWLGGTTAPSWQLAATDTSGSRVTALGRIGVHVYTSASTAKAAPVTVAGVVGWYLSAAARPTSGQPGQANTGVPVGTALTQHYGDMKMTTAGATYDRLDIHGFVTILAPHVTITRSIIRGGVATSGNPGLVTDTAAAGTNFVLTDSELVPEHPSVAIDGIRGGNYTLTRDNIHDTVDTAKVLGNDVTIQDSWLHHTVHYTSDPYQSNGPSHNDGVQVLSGTRIRILNNTINGADNSAMQITQGNGAVSALSFTGNWADGGACTVNVADVPLPTMSGITVSDNRFGHTSLYKNCAIIVSPGVSMTATGNTWVGTTEPVVVTPR